MPRFGGDWGCVQRVSGKIQIFRSFFTTFSGYVGGDGGSCRADVGCVCGIGDKPKLNGHSHWYVVSSWLRIHWTELKCHYYPCTLNLPVVLAVLVVTVPAGYILFEDPFGEWFQARNSIILASWARTHSTEKKNTFTLLENQNLVIFVAFGGKFDTL